MQPGLDVFTWTIKRLAIALAILAGLVVLAYLGVVAVVVVAQAAAGFGH